MSELPYVLGVDPGKTAGWALIDPLGKPVFWGTVRPLKRRTYARRVLDVIEQCRHCCGQHWPPVLAIEGQFIPTKAGQTEKDRHKAVATLMTARYAGHWLGICEAHEIPIFAREGIHPSKWRAKIWGRGPARGRWTTEAAKEQALRLTEAQWGISIAESNHHTAEAIWIAKYAQIEIRMKRIMG